jgi:hypothetical protein
MMKPHSESKDWDIPEKSLIRSHIERLKKLESGIYGHWQRSVHRHTDTHTQTHTHVHTPDEEFSCACR